MKITLTKLRRWGATCGDLQVFKRQWPRGAQLTCKNVELAADLGLDLGWLATQVMQEYGGARLQYQAIENCALRALCLAQSTIQSAETTARTKRWGVAARESAHQAYQRTCGMALLVALKLPVD